MCNVNTPEILDFFSHYRNLLVHFVDVFTTAGTHGTHGCECEVFKKLSVKNWNTNDLTSTFISLLCSNLRVSASTCWTSGFHVSGDNTKGCFLVTIPKYFLFVLFSWIATGKYKPHLYVAFRISVRPLNYLSICCYTCVQQMSLPLNLLFF